MDSVFVLFLFNGLFSSFIYICVASEDNVTTEYGQTAELICPLSQDLAITFWMKGTTFYNVPGSTVITPTVPNVDRLEINATNAGLLIHNVTLQDQAIYKCAAVLSNGTEIIELWLEVTNVPPSSIAVENIEKHNRRDVIHGQEDATLTLTCLADGAKPEPNITWTRSDTNVTFNSTSSVHRYSNGTFAVSSSVELITDRSLDGVVFLCTVSHQTLESSVEKSVAIFLDLKPRVLEIEDPTITTEGFNVTFKCEVYAARPAANISLYLNDEEQSGLDENYVVRNEFRDTYRTTTMFHRIMDRQDDGKTVKCAIHHSALENNINKTWIVVVYYIPYIVEGHTEYLTGVDESIEVVLDVYSNVEPIHVSITTKTDAWETTAVWTIKDNIRKTVGIPVYNQKTLISGFRITADFEVQAEKNYGDYKIVVRNEIGSTSHYFKVLPRAVVTTGAPSAKVDDTNVVAIVVGVVVPVVFIAAVAVAIIVYCKKNPQKPTVRRLRDPTKFKFKKYFRNKFARVFSFHHSLSC